VVAPSVLNVEAVTLDGLVTLTNIDGYHVVTGSSVLADNVYGDLDAYADGGDADVEIFPYEGSIIRVESFGGDASVALPWGLAYDLRVYSDPDYGYEITDLGFDELVLGGDYAIGSTGAGSIRVEVIATGGSVWVTEAF